MGQTVTPQRARDALVRFNLIVTDSQIPQGSLAGNIAAANPIKTEGARFFFGAIRTFTPPDFKQKTAEWPTMGDGQIEVDLGLEKLPFTFTSARYHPASRALYGKFVKFSLKAGLWYGDTRRHDGLYTITCEGEIQQVTASQVTAGELPDGMTVMMNCYKYKEELKKGSSSRKYVDIDILGFKREIDGLDQLADLRAHLGLLASA